MTQLYNDQRRHCLQGLRGVALTAFLAPLAMAPITAQAQVLDLNDAINKAGRQRMHSQRTAKAWLAIGQDIEAVKAVWSEYKRAQQRVFFDNALRRIGRQARTPRHSAEVLCSSENIPQIMDRATGLCARLT